MFLWDNTNLYSYKRNHDEEVKGKANRSGAGLLRLGRALQEAQQQVNGFEALASCLATGHAHLPLPDVSQGQVSQ